jgi:anti-sigma-K factor RskA
LVFSVGGLSVVGLVTYRLAVWLYRERRLAAGVYAKNVVLVGHTSAVAWMIDHFRRNVPTSRFRLAGWLSVYPTAETAPDDPHLPRLGAVEDLRTLLINSPLHEVIAVQSWADRDWLTGVIEDCDYFRVRLRIVPEALLAGTLRDLRLVFRTDPLRLPEVGGSSLSLAEQGVILLSRRLNRWRGAAVACGALAAMLALFVSIAEFAPQRLPASLPPPAPEVAAPSGRFVAVLQKDASAPAFLLTVDVDHRSLTVRRVDARQQPGKSYQLWLVSNRFQTPRSLGVVGTGDFTQSPLLASYDKETIDNATYAVSLEPEGGSPKDVPTGPVLYLGKLVEATPAEPARNP